jgi:hypothetical protein
MDVTGSAVQCRPGREWVRGAALPGVGGTSQPSGTYEADLCSWHGNDFRRRIEDKVDRSSTNTLYCASIKGPIMELPFLYQTRTILRSCPRFRAPGLIQRRYLESSAATDPKPQQSNGDANYFFQRKAAEVASKYPRGTLTTITPEEKRAFENLRALSGQKSARTPYGLSAPEPHLLDTDPDSILSLFTPVANESEQNSFEDAGSLFDVEEVADPYEAETPSPPKEAPPPDEPTEAKRIISKICTIKLHEFDEALKKALNNKTQPSDLAIWNELSKSIFPLITLLTRPSNKIVKSSKKAKTKSKLTATAKSLESQRETALKLLDLTALSTEHAQISPPPRLDPLKVLSRLYPASLLLALRQLAKHHPLSPHTHRVLPHTRALGPSSYVLGATAPFYNTILLLRWNVYGSLSELCDILDEMQRAAIDADRGTYHFLTDLADERARDLAALGALPPTTAGDVDDAPPPPRPREPEWWMLPEQRKSWAKVEEYKRLLALELEEQGMGAVLREGPSDLIRGDAAPQVWL